MPTTFNEIRDITETLTHELTVRLNEVLLQQAAYHALTDQDKHDIIQNTLISLTLNAAGNIALETDDAAELVLDSYITALQCVANAPQHRAFNIEQTHQPRLTIH